MDKHWITQATSWLKACREPVPHEINELDWKVGLSEKRERLIEHLIAFSNNTNGGYLVFGVSEPSAELVEITQNQVTDIVSTLTNLSRDSIEPPIVLDYAIVEVDQVPLLFINIPECRNKPAHRRGKSIEEAWVRSGGTTRKASRHDIGALMLHSQAPRWEELRASLLLTARNVIESLELGIIAKLLQHPLPAEETELMHWLTDENMVTPDRGKTSSCVTNRHLKVYSSLT